MSYLKRLPVSNLKIDKSFLDTVMEDVCDQKIIQAIISLARNLILILLQKVLNGLNRSNFCRNPTAIWHRDSYTVNRFLRRWQKSLLRV